MTKPVYDETPRTDELGPDTRDCSGQRELERRDVWRYETVKPDPEMCGESFPYGGDGGFGRCTMTPGHQSMHRATSPIGGRVVRWEYETP